MFFHVIHSILVFTDIQKDGAKVCAVVKVPATPADIRSREERLQRLERRNKSLQLAIKVFKARTDDFSNSQSEENEVLLLAAADEANDALDSYKRTKKTVDAWDDLYMIPSQSEVLSILHPVTQD